MFGRIDHIGVAVDDLDAAIELHTRAYGMELVHRETVESQGVEAVLLDVGENHVELLSPLSEETPVGKFLAKRGPGLHHVAYQVPDIDAALAESLHQWSGSTSSVSTPPVERGCRNATRLPWMPTRGSSSISATPDWRSESSVASMSSAW